MNVQKTSKGEPKKNDAENQLGKNDCRSLVRDYRPCIVVEVIEIDYFRVYKGGGY